MSGNLDGILRKQPCQRYKSTLIIFSKIKQFKLITDDPLILMERNVIDGQLN